MTATLQEQIDQLPAADRLQVEDTLARLKSSGVPYPLRNPSDTETLLQRLLRVRGIDPAGCTAGSWEAPVISSAFGPCQGMRPGDLGCDTRVHLRQHPTLPRMTQSSPCPLVRIRAEAERLRLLLEQCGATLDPSIDSVHAQILKAYDVARPVDVYYPPSESKHPLRELRGFFSKLARGERAFDRHVFLFGRPGNGKSTICLAGHFGALLLGIDSQWIDTQELLEKERARRNRNEAKQHEGSNYFTRLKRANLIFCSDLGLRAPDTNDYPRGSDLLWEIQEAAPAVWIANSNHAPDVLLRHNDVGARVMSRLLGNRKGVPAVVIKTDGPDQRKHR